MTFSEKLNLLMNITNTSNSVLARHISLDASFISRLRRGERTPAKNENYIKTMATYFARHCAAEYQKAALREALNITSKNLPADSKTAELIYAWLSDKKPDNPQSTESFIKDPIRFKFKKEVMAIEPASISTNSTAKGTVFYGIKGKQEAVINFLSLVLKNKSPQTLLLYSDEDLGWLAESREFMVKWATLLSQVIRNGNQIKIIHTVRRDIDEMFTAIEKWLPLYMTGAIEPYYYPKTRDGVFRRTLFIAPDSAAVSSTSVGNVKQNAANFLFTDSPTIKALIEEYNHYLALCRPLMHIFTSVNKDEYRDALADFEHEGANSIIKTNVLSSITMPMEVAESILSRSESDAKSRMLSYQQKRIISLENSLQKHSFTEIITIPDGEKIKSGKVEVSFADMLGDTQSFYKPEEFCRHLQNVIRLLQTSTNYHVYLGSDEEMASYLLYAKEDVGVIVARMALPPVIFAINESNMTAAFWDYMNVLIHTAAKGDLERNHTIARLESTIEELSL